MKAACTALALVFAALLPTPAGATPQGSAAVPQYNTIVNEAFVDGEVFHPSGDVSHFDIDDSGESMVTVNTAVDGSTTLWLYSPDSELPVEIASAGGAAPLQSLMISPNGRWVVFTTWQPGLVDGFETFGQRVVYRFDTTADTLVGVSDPSADALNPSVASDGSVAFVQRGGEDTTYRPWLFDAQRATTEQIALDAEGAQLLAGDSTDVAVSVAADLTRYVAITTFGVYANDAVADENWGEDVVVWSSAEPNVLRYASVSSDGSSALGGSVSAQGFNNDATLLAITSRGAIDPEDGDADSDVYLLEREGTQWSAPSLATAMAGSYGGARVSGSTVTFIGSGAYLAYHDGSDDVGGGVGYSCYVLLHDQGRVLRISTDVDGTRPDADVYGGDSNAAGTASFWATRATDVTREDVPGSSDAAAFGVDVFRTQVPAAFSTLSLDLPADGVTRTVTATGGGGVTDHMQFSLVGPATLSATADVSALDASGSGTIEFAFRAEDLHEEPGTGDVPASLWAMNRFGEYAKLVDVTMQPQNTLNVSFAAPGTFRPGSTAPLPARLVGESGEPVVGVAVKLRAVNTDGSSTVVGSAVSGADGVATFTLPVSSPRTLFAEVPADTAAKPRIVRTQSPRQQLYVTTAVTTTRSVSATTLTVRASTSGAPTGTAALQKLSAGTWSTVATKPVSSSSSTFTTTLSAGTATYRVRFAPSSQGWKPSVSMGFAAQPKLRFAAVSKSRSGSTLRVSSSVIPAQKGKRVSLQRYVSGTWRTVAYAYQASTGSFAIVWKTMPAGSSRLRLVAEGTTPGGYASAASAEFTAVR